MNKRTAVCGIYFIFCTANSGLYVGSSNDVRQRLHYHFSSLRRDVHDNGRLQNTFNKYGANQFTAGLLEPVSSQSDLLSREQVWLDSGVATLNLAGDASSPMLGKKHSAETRQAMSETRKGRQQSTEHRANRSAAFTPARRAEMSVRMRGRVVSPENRAKLSAFKTAWWAEKRAKEALEAQTL